MLQDSMQTMGDLFDKSPEEDFGGDLWNVVLDVEVRLGKDDLAVVLGAKQACETVRGTLEGDWIKLAGEPGYVRVRSKRERFLEKHASVARSAAPQRGGGSSRAALRNRPHIGLASAYRPHTAAGLP